MSSKCESGAYMYISLLFITLSTTALTDADNSGNSRCLTLVTKIDKIIFVIPRLNSKLVIILVVQITLSFHWLASIGLKWHHRFFSRKDWGSREYLKFIYVERLPVYSKMISKKKKNRPTWQNGSSFHSVKENPKMAIINKMGSSYLLVLNLPSFLLSWL